MEIRNSSRVITCIDYLTNIVMKGMTNHMFPWKFFPFDENLKKMMNQIKPGEIEKYTQNMIEKMMPSHLNNKKNQNEMLRRSLFGYESAASINLTSLISILSLQTHEHVYVRLKIANEEWLKKMKIYHTSNLMIIEHIPNNEDKHTITLPAIVRKKGAKANYRDETLEIRINKTVDMQYSEIEVE